MKKFLLLTILAVGWLKAEIIEQVYYVVNDDIITRLDFLENKKNSSNAAAMSGVSIPTDEQIISNMIFNILIRQKAEQEDIILSGADVSNQLKWQLKEWGLESFEQLKMALRQQQTTYTVFFNNMRNNMYREQLLQKLTMTADPSTYQMENYYKENLEEKFRITNSIYNISRILFKKGENLTWSDMRKQRKMLNDLHRKIMEKEINFNQACKTVNDQKNPNISAGDIGWITPVTMKSSDPYMYQQLISLEKGNISDIIEGEQGAYIIKINDIKSSGYFPFELVKPMIKNYLIMEQRQQKLEMKLNHFIRNSLISKKTDYFNNFNFR